MEENSGGKRMAAGAGLSRGKKVGLVVIAAVFALLVGSYLGLCAYVANSGTVLPNVSAAGVALGGLTRAQAETRLSDEISARYSDQTVAFLYSDGVGSDQKIVISGRDVTIDASAVADTAVRYGRTGGFFGGGSALLSALFSGYQIDAPLKFRENADANGDISALAKTVEEPVLESKAEVTGTAIVIHKGQPGYKLDTDALKERILQTFENGGAGGDAFTVAPVTILPAEIDFDALYNQVYTVPKNAEVDHTSYQIIPHVTGVSFDVNAAREQYDHTGWGSRCEIVLILEEPETTTQKLDALLFANVLGTATSKVGGTANRKSNVTLAASSCNGRVLFPGEVFSYNTATGPRTTEAGYLPAPAYIKGQSVDEIGGGICQVSSTIYYASLNSNLKIVERYNHTYAVGYVPDGMDATVYYGSLDFRFENSTQYPIKVVTSVYKVSGTTYLKVNLLGTKSDETYVKMTNEVLSTTPWETIYRIDSSMPAGSPKEDVTPYTGKKVNAYRNVYAADGTLISRTLESVSNYKKRDQVYLLNPADAPALGLDPVTGKPVSAPATITPSPETTPVPGVTPGPEVTPVPEVTPPPETTPAVTPETQAVPEASPTSEVNPTAEATSVPQILPTPVPRGT